MKMIDVAIPQFDDHASTRPSPIPIARKPSAFAQSRIEDEEEYHLEDEKDEEEDAGGKDEFFDTEDIADGVSTRSPRLERS